ncbi:MAG TPA: hypothetical protein VGD67_09890 [Pseudonocardiaceae bacterium]
MPRPRTPDGVAAAERAAIREIAARMAELETQLDELRDRRNAAMVAAKRAGATAEQLAGDADIERRNVHRALAAAGYTTSRTAKYVRRPAPADGEASAEDQAATLGGTPATRPAAAGLLDAIDRGEVAEVVMIDRSDDIAQATADALDAPVTWADDNPGAAQ